jgi:hypothetical protein
MQGSDVNLSAEIEKGIDCLGHRGRFGFEPDISPSDQDVRLSQCDIDKINKDLMLL